MILAGGKLYDSAEQNRILNGLEKRINRTMADKKLLAETVIEAFDRLTQIEPQLKEFLYVFDTPSSDERALQRMAQLADGIVVWGGDEAVASIRRLAPAGARLIEWGEKLGFAYLSGFRDKDTELKELAEHIISTKQLLCSSCQTIFLDTYRMEEVWHFCGEFLPYLEAAAKSRRQESPARIAEETLWSYHRYLEQILKRTEYRRVGKRAAACDTRIFGGHRCSLTACRDSRLELSGQFGHCLVKRLPKEQLVSKLRREKGRLQTAGLICPEEKRTELTKLLARCGVTRITTAGAMSEPLGGESHDGEYPLRRYVRLVSIEE